MVKVTTEGKTFVFESIEEATNWIEDNLTNKDSYSYELEVHSPKDNEHYFYYQSLRTDRERRIDVV